MNLLNLLKYHLGSSLNDQVSTFLGEEPNHIQTALDATLPSIMSVLVKKGSDLQGAEELLQTIHNQKHDGTMLNYLTGLFSGGSSTDSLLRSGERLSTKYLGNKQSLLVEAISNYSGTKRSSASSIIKMAFPLILGVIGKQVKNQNLDHSGLFNLLSSQKGHIGAAIPPQFNGMSIFDTNSTVTGSTQSEREFETNIKKASPATYVEQTSIPKEPNSFIKYLPIVLACILGIIVLAFILRNYNEKNNPIVEESKEISAEIIPIPKKRKEINTTTTPTPKKEIEEEVKKVEETKIDEPKIIDKPESIKQEPKPEITPKLKPKPKPKTEVSKQTYVSGTFKNKIDNLITNGGLGGEAINFNSLKFKGNSAIINRNSRPIVKELAASLKENPTVRIKVESSNPTRTASLKKALMDAGINRDRIQMEAGQNSGIKIYLY